jgi:hypothetical protein
MELYKRHPVLCNTILEIILLLSLPFFLSQKKEQKRQGSTNRLARFAELL